MTCRPIIMIGCLLQCGTLALASRMIWLLWLLWMLSLLLALLLALLFVVVVVWLLVLLLPSQKPRIIFAPMSEPLLLQLGTTHTCSTGSSLKIHTTQSANWHFWFCDDGDSREMRTFYATLDSIALTTGTVLKHLATSRDASYV